MPANENEQPPGEEPKPRRESELASSVPDDSTTLLKMLKRIERLGNNKWFQAILIGAAVMFWTVVRFGGDLAIKIYPMVAELSRLATQHSEFVLTESMKSGTAASQKQDAVNTKVLDGISQINGKVDRVVGDVAVLKGAQASTNRRLSNVAQQQDALKRRVETTTQPGRPPPPIDR